MSNEIASFRPIGSWNKGCKSLKTALRGLLGQGCVNSSNGSTFRHKMTEFYPKLQLVGILLSRIPDISGRKSGHFGIVAFNLSIFGLKSIK